jgi:ribosome-binding protein aMBF1 (putative translation factor)
VMASELLCGRQSRKLPRTPSNPSKGVALQHDAVEEHGVTVEHPARRELTRGQRVRIARVQRGWSRQRDLALRAGLLERTISLVEQDHTTLRDKTIFKLSLALDLNVEDLLV